MQKSKEMERLHGRNYLKLNNSQQLIKNTVINFKLRKLSGNLDEGKANLILLDNDTALEPETIEIANEGKEEDNVELQESDQHLEHMRDLDERDKYTLQNSELVAMKLRGQLDFKLEEDGTKGTDKSLVKQKCYDEYPKVFLCPYCEKTFTQKGSLMEHYHIHTGDKPFTCDLCGRKFRQKSTMQTHRATHNGDKRFECGVCYRRFHQKANLIRHFTTHTGEKPFKCELCGHKFTQKGSLNKHMKSHSSIVDIRCDYCDTKYRSYSAKLRHQKAVHSTTNTRQDTEEEIVIQPDFNCDQCPAQFKSYEVLKKHKTFHE